MLIAFVSPNGWTVYNFRLDVIRALQQDGHRILVIAGEDVYSPLLEAEGCRFIAVPFSNRSVNPLTDWRLYRALRKIYRAEKPDLIFHYAIKANIWGSLAASREKTRSIAVVTGLGYPFSARGWVFQLASAGYRIAGRKASEMWFLNAADAATFRDLQLVPAGKMRLLPGEGINTDYFRRQSAYGHHDGPFRFLLCSRLLSSKGIGDYARAIAALQLQGLSVEGGLLGIHEKDHPDGLREEELKDYIHKGWLRYYGAAADVRPWLERADAYAFTSYYNEGVPRSLMEAASMALPVVVPDLRGCRDLLENGKTGFLFRPRQLDDLVLHMKKMVELSAEERRRMGEAGRERMEAAFETRLVIAIYRETIAKSL